MDPGSVLVIAFLLGVKTSDGDPADSLTCPTDAVIEARRGGDTAERDGSAALELGRCTFEADDERSAALLSSLLAAADDDPHAVRQLVMDLQGSNPELVQEIRSVLTSLEGPLSPGGRAFLEHSPAPTTATTAAITTTAPR